VLLENPPSEVDEEESFEKEVEDEEVLEEEL
jgi:hypothetical protein